MIVYSTVVFLMETTQTFNKKVVSNLIYTAFTLCFKNHGDLLRFKHQIVPGTWPGVLKGGANFCSFKLK